MRCSPTRRTHIPASCSLPPRSRRPHNDDIPRKEKPVTRRQRIDDLTAFAIPEQPALSADGATIAYVVRTVDAKADREVRTVWRVGTRSGEPQQLTRGQADLAPAWSPDGTRIAFLRAQDGPPQIWLLP